MGEGIQDEQRPSPASGASRKSSILRVLLPSICGARAHNGCGETEKAGSSEMLGWPLLHPGHPESPSELMSTVIPLLINQMVRQIWKLDIGEKRWLSPQECAGQLRLSQMAQDDAGTIPSGHAGQPPGWVVV